MFLISSRVPFCSLPQHAEALGQTAPSMAKLSAQTEKGEHAKEKWSRMPCECALGHTLRIINLSGV